MKEKFAFIFKLFDLFDKKEKIQFFSIVAASLFMAFFQAVGIASVLPFINMVMNPEIINENSKLNYIFNFFNFQSINSFMIFSGFAVLAILVIGNAIIAFATWLKINFAWKKNYSLSVILLERYLFMPYSYFLNNNTSELGKNVLAEVQQFTSNLILPLINIIVDSMIVLVVLILLISVNFKMTIISMLILISLYLLIYFYFSEKLKSGGQQRLYENKQRFKSANESLEGIKDIKVLGVEKFFLEKFSKHSQKFSKLQSWNQAVGQIPRYVLEIVAFGGIVALVIFSISINMPTQKIIPLISLFAFAGYRLMPALQEIFNSMALIKFNIAVVDKIYKDINSENLINKNLKPSIIKINPVLFRHSIKLENIYFSYPNSEKLTLNNISLEIKKNTFIGIVGSTGSGKTTLVDLILGLFYPNEGNFKVDNILINRDNIKNWRLNLGYVPQQIYLSDDTIARNIAFGLSDDKIDINQVKKVAQMANLSKFIEKELADGYNTIIGEKGIRLSGGQRQRIGIARALYHNPQVLIFDEATSSLDNKTEKEVLEAIEGIAKTKTIIAIAHRLTTVKNSDIVYVMEKGKIVDQGIYEEIIARTIK